jgi:beta-galactosidase/beta-glucuronidase
VFLKGANYASMNIYNGKEDIEKMKRVIDIAVESNYNAIRLWGGG